MRTTILLAALSPSGTGAQGSGDLLAKESELKARTPYETMRTELPGLTRQNYDAIIRGRARQELAKARSQSFKFSTFRKRTPGTSALDEPFRFSKFGGVSGAATRFEPFAIKSPSEKANGVFQFHFGNQLTGTDRQIGSFSLDEPGNGTHCTRMRDGSFVRTRCF